MIQIDKQFIQQLFEQAVVSPRLRQSFDLRNSEEDHGDLKNNIKYQIGMERQSGNMDASSPLYVARMLNVPVEEVERCI